jgi:fructokinase
MDPLYAGIEGGGTKFVCAIARDPEQIIDSVTIPTTDAATTLAACVRFLLAAQQALGPIAALGFACFGPLELRKTSINFGRLMQTPKPGWSGVDLLETFRSTLRVPIVLDTDVGAAALAEWRLGAGRDVGSLAYVTVGTGIGGAVAPTGLSAGRLMHEEMGHIPVRRDYRDLDFSGVCPFHGDCVEGLASGSAIRARWGSVLEALPAEHDCWSIISGYLGQLAASVALMHSVERIVFGGGVIANGVLLPYIRSAMLDYLNGYLEPLNGPDNAVTYVCAPALGTRAGITGALLLAATADDRSLRTVGADQSSPWSR